MQCTVKTSDINAMPDVPDRLVYSVTRARMRAHGEVPKEPGTSGIIAENRHSAILALDLGTTTGWAMRLADATIVSGTMAFRPGRYEGGGMRYLRFRTWLDELHRQAPTLSALYFEEVRRHAGTDAAHIYGGFLAHLSAWCEQRRLPYQGVPVGVIKRHATGRGNADKQAMISAITSRGFQVADDNEADAVAILLWATETAGGAR